MKPILILPLARPTFDVPYAEEMAARAFAALDAAGIATLGARSLLFDADAARHVITSINAADISGILLMQVTFCDASMAVEIARAFPATPLGIWAFPEPRAGGRLRLNAFCGLNLAAHALGRAGFSHGTLYAAPEAAGLARSLADLFNPKPQPVRLRPANAAADAPELDGKIKNVRLGLIGEHPTGFDTCRYEDADLATLSGVTVEKITLTETFTRARAVDSAATAARLTKARETYAGLEEVDQGQLNKSLALHTAMDDLRVEKKLDGIAMRCWPETFTEYGCAVCGPMGMMTEAGTPCACEADVYGALTALLMQAAAGAPAWLVDIVDMDAASDTGVIWHCGSAPLSMCDPAFAPEAQIHSNRKMPLLAQFPLKPGRITIARISQAQNRLTLVLGAGEVVSAPMSFTGTSGVVRFDGGTKAAMDVLLGETLEHHIAITYGDTRAALEGWAALKNLPVLDLTA